jgi:hypothetical protein
MVNPAEQLGGAASRQRLSRHPPSIGALLCIRSCECCVPKKSVRHARREMKEDRGLALAIY